MVACEPKTIAGAMKVRVWVVCMARDARRFLWGTMWVGAGCCGGHVFVNKNILLDALHAHRLSRMFKQENVHQACSLN